MSIPAPTAATNLVTLRAVLRLPAMRRGLPEVLSGHDQLDRPVRWAHVGELPNMAEVLKGGELLLTTGMGIGASEQERRRYVDALASRGIAGLAIELGSTFDAVPRAVVEQAQRRDLPLIAMHHEVLGVEITEAVHREIVNRQFLLMRRGEELHQRFTALMLEGAGIPEVLAVLAEAIANPVVLESADETILYHATHQSDDATVLAAWAARRQGDAAGIPIVELPVPIGGDGSHGMLMALGLDSPLADFDRLAVERAVSLIALALLQSRQEALLAARERGDFLARLLDRDIPEAEAAAHAHVLGFPREARAMLPIAMAPAPSLGPAGTDEAAWATVWRAVRRALGQQHLPSIVGSRGPDRAMLAVLAIERDIARADAAETAARLVQRAAGEQYRTPNPVVLVVGPEARTWGDVRRGLRETSDAVWPAAHAPERPWHDVTEPDLDRLLWSLRDHQALDSFVRLRLRTLTEHDARRSSELMTTLRAYCAHAGRRGDTARALNIERQTLYYRLGRIEKLLGRKLTDGETLLDVHLAVRAQAYMSAAVPGELHGVRSA
jgi:purine catabolism regulator